MQRNAQHQTPGHEGFTLIEVLTSLGLCALLAASTASAIAFSSRAERIATRHGTASLLVSTLYTEQRLRPDDLADAPKGWTIERTTEIKALPNDELCEWHLVVLRDNNHEMPPVTLHILNETP